MFTRRGVAIGERASSRWVALLCGSVLSLALIPGDSQAAAQLSASPLLLRLPADKVAASLTLGNNGPKPVTVQADLLSWNQDNGQDTYAAASDLVVNPPLFSIAPGSVQVVRIGRLKRVPAPDRELAYRVKIAEIPSQEMGQNAIATVLQMTIPLFVPPAKKGKGAVLEWRARFSVDGKFVLAVSNPGNEHAKVARLALAQGGKIVAERPRSFYVLAKARRELNWEEAAKAIRPGPAELHITLEGRRNVAIQPLQIESLVSPPSGK
jgi:fimbrial chaperone protein